MKPVPLCTAIGKESNNSSTFEKKLHELDSLFGETQWRLEFMQLHLQVDETYTDKPLGECLFLTDFLYSVTIVTGTSTLF